MLILNITTVLCTVVMYCASNVSDGYWASLENMVCTDPGKVWKVLEFNVEIFKALKSLENDHRYGKVWKNP